MYPQTTNYSNSIHIWIKNHLNIPATFPKFWAEKSKATTKVTLFEPAANNISFRSRFRPIWISPDQIRLPTLRPPSPFPSPPNAPDFPDGIDTGVTLHRNKIHSAVSVPPTHITRRHLFTLFPSGKSRLDYRWKLSKYSQIFACLGFGNFLVLILLLVSKLLFVIFYFCSGRFK